MLIKRKQISNTSVKNYQSDAVIRKMYEQAFNKDASNIKISKLSGGLKNAVYLIEDETQKLVLKIGPKDETKMITADRNILWWKVEMLKLMETIKLSAPRVLYFNNESQICSSPYFFMTYIDGQNYLQVKDSLSEEEINNIEYQLGVLSHKICSIKSHTYFLPSQPTKRFNNNYEFILNLFEMLLSDAASKKMDLGEDGYNKILQVIESNKDSLNNITNLCLSHTDLWDGNVMVKDGKIAGIIDFSDLYYCDELLTFYFHTIDGQTSSKFLKGFDNKQLNHDEKVRIEIYRIYVILKMIVDCELKQYGRHTWMYDNINTRLNTLKRSKD